MSGWGPIERERHREAWKRVRPLVSDRLVEEHRRDPFGEHSAELELVLDYLRRWPDRSAPLPVVVCARERAAYYLAELPGGRGEAVRVRLDQVYGSEAEAAHAVFQERLARLEPTGDQGDWQESTRRESVVGYCDRSSAAPGETVRFFVSCEGVRRYSAGLVRLVHGNPHPDGPGLKHVPVESPLDGEHPGRRQRTAAGSYGLIADHEALRLEGSFSLQALIQPTAPAAAPQGILTKVLVAEQAGYGLFIDEDGRVAGCLGDGAGRVAWVRAERPVIRGRWYLVGLSFDADRGIVRVTQHPFVSATTGRIAPPSDEARAQAVAERVVDVSPATGAGTPFVVAGAAERLEAGRTPVCSHFNGKIDRPRVASRALELDEMIAWIEDPDAEHVVAAWDFSLEPGADVEVFADRSPNGLHGRLVNLPARAVTGYNWCGRDYRFTDAPSEYGAVHFHDDDLADAGWEPDLELAVAPELPSGVYALRLRAGPNEDLVPFVVRPARGHATARIAVLLPTYTYLAYANDHFPVDTDLWERVAGAFLTLKAHDLFRHGHREYGSSLYDTHADGSGVAYSSWLRPILTLRPTFASTEHPRPGVVSASSSYGLNADLALVDWLTEMEYQYDVVTDRDLHAEGVSLLAPYRVVLTGSHPEYYTEAMLDGLETYRDSGGRLMYLGGNGFYWVIAVHPENPEVIEVRRWGGTGTWSAAPGEHYLSFTGEPGGLWRNRGRPPQKLVGIGMIAQNGDGSSYYRRRPDSLDPQAAWIFAGVDPEETIGDFGLLGGGAAGHELDVYDRDLGSPPHALVLASSEGHSRLMLEVIENLPMTTPHLGGSSNPRVRADMVYFTLPGGGAVFSVGSITWCGSLSHGGYENNVSRITGNVLRRFLADEALPGATAG